MTPLEKIRGIDGFVSLTEEFYFLVVQVNVNDHFVKFRIMKPKNNREDILGYCPPYKLSELERLPDHPIWDTFYHKIERGLERLTSIL